MVRKQYLPKKNPALSPKIGGKKSCHNPFQAILRLKKVAWTTICQYGGVVVRPLKKKTFFMRVFPKC